MPGITDADGHHILIHTMMHWCAYFYFEIITTTNFYEKVHLRVFLLRVLFAHFSLRDHKCLEALLADEAHCSRVDLVLRVAILGILLRALLRVSALAPGFASVGTTHVETSSCDCSSVVKQCDTQTQHETIDLKLFYTNSLNEQ